MTAAELTPITNKRMLSTFRRTSNPGGPTRLECWGAESVDGVWLFEREESSGTPWLVIHRQTGEIVATVGTLRKAQLVTNDHRGALILRANEAYRTTVDARANVAARTSS